METFLKILDILEKALTVGLLIGGVVAFLFKAWIAEWIKKRFASAMSKELDQQRHKLAQELEAYKGGIFKELEQFRANTDIKRSIALKMADARLDALKSLIVDLDLFINEALSMCTMTPDMRARNNGEYNEAVKSIRLSKRNSELFLRVEYVGKLTGAMVRATKLVLKCSHEDIVMKHEDEELIELARELTEVSYELRQIVLTDFPIGGEIR